MPSLNALLGHVQLAEPLVESSLDEANQTDAAENSGLQLDPPKEKPDLANTTALASDQPEDITDSTLAEEVIPSVFELVPAEERILKGDRDYLYWNKNFEVLMYDAWRHPLNADAEDIRYSLYTDKLPEGISSGLHVDPPSEPPNKVDSDVKSHDERVITTAFRLNSDSDSSNGIPADAFSQSSTAIATSNLQTTLEALDPDALPTFINANEYAIAGTLTFSLQRYLHLQTNLWYAFNLPRDVEDENTDATPDSLPPEEPRWHYTVHKESRRLKTGEFHYLDHPLIGIMATIIPWEPPVDEEPDLEEIDAENAAITADKPDD